MISPRTFHVIALAWIFGWGFLLLKFPRQCFRVLAWGRQPTQRNLKIAKIVGYMGLGFGTLLLIEIAFGLLTSN
jgi:hypothetical protein